MSSQYIGSVADLISEVPPSPNVASSSTSSSASTSYSFLGFSWQIWIIIILILALLGINIFTFLEKGTQETANIIDKVFGPILKLLGYTTLTTTKQTIETSATGAKTGVEVAAGAAIDTIDVVQDAAENIPTGQMSSTSGGSSIQTNTNTNATKFQQDSLTQALNASASQQQQSQVMPDDSRSTIQTTGKSGWCYIGEEQNIRSCAEVGVNDVCMSGDVFPTQDVCMNPKLRA
jgi:ABC-type Na+ efflux pump permease subunit